MVEERGTYSGPLSGSRMRRYGQTCLGRFFRHGFVPPWSAPLRVAERENDGIGWGWGEEVGWPSRGRCRERKGREGGVHAKGEEVCGQSLE